MRTAPQGKPDDVGTLEQVVIETIADCLRHRHGLAAFCTLCRRWADLDLQRLVERGRGRTRIATLRPVCRRCDERGELQLRPPIPTWGGYHEWHGAAAPKTTSPACARV
jgi:hypothetical protein